MLRSDRLDDPRRRRFHKLPPLRRGPIVRRQVALEVRQSERGLRVEPERDRDALDRAPLRRGAAARDARVADVRRPHYLVVLEADHHALRLPLEGHDDAAHLERERERPGGELPEIALHLLRRDGRFALLARRALVAYALLHFRERVSHSERVGVLLVERARANHGDHLGDAHPLLLFHLPFLLVPLHERARERYRESQEGGGHIQRGAIVALARAPEVRRDLR